MVDLTETCESIAAGIKQLAELSREAAVDRREQASAHAADACRTLVTALIDLSYSKGQMR